ncbi:MULTISPECIES: glycosyltransferase family 2 protein [unclassified Paraburkholderia]|uniref:glycosyltransferase family 2 protein n=1 Tax=unclassified Paraburkholderia TaxID=2615204 RepID=UPI002AB040A1|nr:MULTISPECIES: glycosyltransferase family 2 protein [unclassified Paraburkholderia]
MRGDLDGACNVSVVIPHYNRLDLLWVAIESIASQTVVPWEIIVVDDASASQFELPSHCGADIKLRLIRETRNRGAAWCRNKGIEEATGDLIAFLDADDRWLPGKLERCIAELGPKPPDHEARVLFSNVMLIDGNQRMPGNAIPYDGQSMLDFILLEGGYIQTSSIMMWRHQYPLISFDGLLRRHQDWDFAIHADILGCKFIYVHDTLSEYSLNGGGLRISEVPGYEPSLVFFNKYRRIMSKRHASSFIFDVLIYKRLSVMLRFGIVSKIVLGEINMPDKGWLPLFVRLIVGRDGVRVMKKLRQKIQIRDYSA